MAVAPVRTDGARHPALRLAGWFLHRLRPPLGWIPFLAALVLQLLLVQAVRRAGWVRLDRLGVTLEWVSVFGLVLAWWLLALDAAFLEGKRGPRWLRLATFSARVVLILVWAAGGVTVLSQVTVHWMPGPLRLWRTAWQGGSAWQDLGQDVLMAWMHLAARLQDWWAGVLAGGARQDDLVFVLWVGVALWLLAGLTAWLAWRTRQGLWIGLPALWSLAAALFYGRPERWLLVLALLVTVALHLWMDQQALEASWRRRRMDFNPALGMDRLIYGLTLAGVVVFLAGVTPSLQVNALAWRAYRALAPVYQPVDDLGERLFPEVERPGGDRFARIGGGLPNRFLLGSGPELSRLEVMRLRTDQMALSYDTQPPRVYLRKATFAAYNGRGWSNPADLERRAFPADEPWTQEIGGPRRRVVQWIQMAVPTEILFAAGEPDRARVDYQAMLHPDTGDLVALWAARGPVVRYAVESLVPAVDEATFLAWPGWGPDRPLPPAYRIYLDLPEAVTPRTVELARRLTAGLDGPVAKARAIEAFLRTIPYDLDVPEPPGAVEVTDYFLFDLQRGYCDYYATAFVVLARLNGLPARLATGYIPLQWDAEALEWVVSEAEAHSWPEVYLPELGWVPFEPTAGRPPLDLAALAQAPARAVPPALPQEPGPEEVSDGPTWNWQMLLWLLPLGLLVWGLWRWWRGRPPRDPWAALVRWGHRLGRPPRPEETELEYAAALAAWIAGHATRYPPEVRRRWAEAIHGLAASIIRARYGPLPGREAAWQEARRWWRALQT